MKARYIAMAIVVAASVLVATPRLLADDKDTKLDKAKDTVDGIRPSDPPKESSGTAKGPTLTKPDPDRKPEPKFKEPPPPKVDKNNPTGDKDVQKGFDKHQKEYKDKNQSDQ
jgi:hypothetical protein